MKDKQPVRRPVPHEDRGKAIMIALCVSSIFYVPSGPVQPASFGNPGKPINPVGLYLLWYSKNTTIASRNTYEGNGFDLDRYRLLASSMYFAI